MPQICLYTTMAPALAKPIADLEIQEWVHSRYGYVPHPYWIGHCNELYP